tara:strand:- start:3640 stop:4668 length:1029 start_codon:yes stop_codon:yes gene_type:complete
VIKRINNLYRMKYKQNSLYSIMKLISFDIGIKNMAYCVLSTTDNTEKPVIIHDWNVLNMIPDENTIHHLCTCMIPGKTKKIPPKACDKKAKYQKDDEFFCDRHAKSNKQWTIPTKKHNLSYIKKLKVDELTTLCNSHMLLLTPETKTIKKNGLIELLTNFYLKICFQPILYVKNKNANHVNLIHIGKTMKHMMNLLPDIDTITHVLIENQISPIANRMKTIQGMLAQFFIMKNDDIHIEFVSSSHKLRQFKDIDIQPYQNTIETNTNSKKTNSNYKSHKNDGIQYCKQIIENNTYLNHWREALNTKKKDDLADSFLQGIWYLKNQNIILYADDLKIKHVLIT